MQIALKLKSMEPKESDQRLAFTYLVSSKEFGDLELKLLIPIQADLTAAEREARKKIEEFAGRVSSGHEGVSIARMGSPAGWEEPAQRPEFAEITVVLKGMLRVEHGEGVLEARAGQAIVADPGEWVRYSTPEPGGAEYIAICVPAFSPDIVHREED